MNGVSYLDLLKKLSKFYILLFVLIFTSVFCVLCFSFSKPIVYDLENKRGDLLFVYPPFSYKINRLDLYRYKELAAQNDWAITFSLPNIQAPRNLDKYDLIYIYKPYYSVFPEFFWKIYFNNLLSAKGQVVFVKSTQDKNDYNEEYSILSLKGFTVLEGSYNDRNNIFASSLKFFDSLLEQKDSSLLQAFKNIHDNVRSFKQENFTIPEKYNEDLNITYTPILSDYYSLCVNLDWNSSKQSGLISHTKGRNCFVLNASKEFSQNVLVTQPDELRLKMLDTISKHLYTYYVKANYKLPTDLKNTNLSMSILSDPVTSTPIKYYIRDNKFYVCTTFDFVPDNLKKDADMYCIVN